MSGIYLTQWKRASILPIFKEEKKGVYKLYFNFFIRFCFERSREMCRHRRVLNATEVLYHLYHDFRTTKCCVLVIEVGSTLNRGMESDVMNLDFSKTFESM